MHWKFHSESLAELLLQFDARSKLETEQQPNEQNHMLIIFAKDHICTYTRLSVRPSARVSKKPSHVDHLIYYYYYSDPK